MQTTKDAQSSLETDFLEASLAEKPKKSIMKSLFNRWTGIYFLLVFLTLKSCGLSDTVNKAVSTYTTAPVLVQVGPDAQPILAKQSQDGVLNEENVLAVTRSLAMTLNNFDPNLPKEAGGGIDKGIKLPGFASLVPTPIALIYQNIVKDPDSPANLAWLEQHMKAAPKEMNKGGKSTLSSIKLYPQKRTGNSVSVIVRALRVEESPDGTPSYMPYNRKYTLEATDRPKFLLGSPTPLQEKYNLFAARGLKLRLPLEDAD